MAIHSIIQGIADYLMTCPLLKDGVFRCDALGSGAIEYAVETGIFTPVLRTYVNGDSERQYQFNFTSREFYSMDRLQNIENTEFYENFADWIESSNQNKKFPEMPDGCYPREINVLSPGYIYDTTMKNARYQIQLQLIYYKEAKNEA